MNIILFLFCYLIIMVILLGLLIYKCPQADFRHFFFIYFFVGMIGTNFLILSCNPFFFENRAQCTNRFLIFSDYCLIFN